MFAFPGAAPADTPRRADKLAQHLFPGDGGWREQALDQLPYVTGHFAVALAPGLLHQIAHHLFGKPGRGAVRLLPDAVITSYSIHYTKLYDRNSLSVLSAWALLSHLVHPMGHPVPPNKA